MNKNVINKEYFNTTRYLKGNVAHKSIFDIICNTAYELGYLPWKDRRFYFKDGSFIKPDFRLWKGEDLFFLIEYQSTNSSDSRVIEDVDRYGSSVAGDTSEILPKYWLIIYTLPDQPVSDWPIHDYRKRSDAYKEMIRNPHKFYKEAFKDPSYLSGPRCQKRNPNIPDYPSISEYTEDRKCNNRRIFLINLTVKGLEIDFPERFNTKYPLQTRTE
jgi:hypothetical protein